MNKAVINVFVPQGTISNKELDQLIKFPCSQFESYGAFLQPADCGFIRVIGGEIFKDRMNLLISFVKETLPGKQIWFQCEFDNNVHVRLFDGEELIYSMDGSIVRGLTEIDQYREQYPGLEKACNERTADIVEYDSQDGHVFLRQFWNEKTITMIDGFINEDKREDTTPFLLHKYGTEVYRSSGE